MIREHRVGTTLSSTERYMLDSMCARLGANRSEFLRELVLIAVGASELRPQIKQAMRATLERSERR